MLALDATVMKMQLPLWAYVLVPGLLWGHSVPRMLGLLCKLVVSAYNLLIFPHRFGIAPRLLMT